MDPYLEAPGLWPDVHHEIISVSREILNQKLRPKYHTRIEERVYISDEGDPGRSVIIPDLRIASRSGHEKGTFQPFKEAGISVAEPVVLTTLLDDEIHEPRIEIIETDGRRLVAIIEVLSPSNKVPGSHGRASFIEKRREIMNSSSHWVEIDLLRMGASFIARDMLPPCDYLVHASHAQKRPKGLVWPIILTQRLPVISIPLKDEDPEIPLDLQQVLSTAYERGAYDLELNYHHEPNPPLPEKYLDWAKSLLSQKG